MKVHQKNFNESPLFTVSGLSALVPWFSEIWYGLFYSFLNAVTSRNSKLKNSLHISYFSDIAYLEWMSFDVCDENGDGGLTWQEVEDCIVSFSNYLI